MSKHYGCETADSVQMDFWLVVKRGEGWQGRPGVRVTAGPPALGRKERAINLRLEMPIALFETPAIIASIKVDAPNEAIHIDAKSIAEAVRGIVGMDIDVQVNQPEGDA